MNYNCKIEFVKKAHENLKNLTNEIIKEFLLTFHKDCSTNVEYLEFSNETLFEILNSNPQLFMIVMKANKEQIQYQTILKTIEEPINGNIDLDGIKAKIEALSPNDELKRKIIKALNTATNKERK
jgi:hypothetical protein